MQEVKGKKRYEVLREELFDEYEIAFEEIEECCQERGLKNKELEIFLGRLVREFIKAQERRKNVKDITLGNIDKFCRIRLTKKFPFKFWMAFYQTVLGIGCSLFFVTLTISLYNYYAGHLLNLWNGWWTASSVYFGMLFSLVAEITYLFFVRRKLFQVEKRTVQWLKKIYVLLPIAVFVIIVSLGNIFSLSIQITLKYGFYSAGIITVLGICCLITYIYSQQIRDKKITSADIEVIFSQFEKSNPKLENRLIHFREYIYEQKKENEQMHLIANLFIFICLIALVICLREFYFLQSQDIFLFIDICLLFFILTYLQIKRSLYEPRIIILEEAELAIQDFGVDK